MRSLPSRLLSIRRRSHLARARVRVNPNSNPNPKPGVGSELTQTPTLSLTLTFRTLNPNPKQAALAQHSPHVVLCCWMPLGQDWSLAMRAAASVTHYLLLGETDDGCCGVPWGKPKPEPEPQPQPQPQP